MTPSNPPPTTKQNSAARPECEGHYYYLSIYYTYTLHSRLTLIYAARTQGSLIILMLLLLLFMLPLVLLADCLLRDIMAEDNREWNVDKMCRKFYWFPFHAHGIICIGTSSSSTSYASRFDLMHLHCRHTPLDNESGRTWRMFCIKIQFTG